MKIYCDPTALAALLIENPASRALTRERNLSTETWHTSTAGAAQLEYLLWRSGKASTLFKQWAHDIEEEIYAVKELSGTGDAFSRALETNRRSQHFAHNPALIIHPWLAAAHEFTHYASASPAARRLAVRLGLSLLPSRLTG